MTKIHVAEKVQAGLDDFRLRYNIDFDHLRNEINLSLGKKIENRLADQIESINLQTESKLQIALARESEIVTKRTNETLNGLR